MCGIFGIIKGKGPALGPAQAASWSRLMGSLAALSTSRGMDSTGFAHAKMDGTVIVEKDAVPAWEMIARADWEAITTPTVDTLATLGHTRMATHGAVVRENAHPFAFTDEDGNETVGIHNGVINNHAKFAAKGGTVYAVDSANLIAALAARKVTEWPRLLRKAEGGMALALVRVNGGRPTVYLTRRGNPIYVTQVAELNATAFASTEAILKGAIKLSRLTANGTRSVPEGVMFDYAPGGRHSEVRRWLGKSKKAKKAEQVGVWDAPTGARKAMGSNGKEYRQCGACLNWLPTGEIAVVNDGGCPRSLCPDCQKMAASLNSAGPGRPGAREWRGSEWATDRGRAKRAAKRRAGVC